MEDPGSYATGGSPCPKRTRRLQECDIFHKRFFCFWRLREAQPVHPGRGQIQAAARPTEGTDRSSDPTLPVLSTKVPGRASNPMNASRGGFARQSRAGRQGPRGCEEGRDRTLGRLPAGAPRFGGMAPRRFLTTASRKAGRGKRLAAGIALYAPSPRPRDRTTIAAQSHP